MLVAHSNLSMAVSPLASSGGVSRRPSSMAATRSLRFFIMSILPASTELIVVSSSEQRM
jgi:hypothetical protein